MSLIRIFLTTCNNLAMAGQFALLREYISQVGAVLAARELLISPGTPEDKEL